MDFFTQVWNHGIECRAENHSLICQTLFFGCKKVFTLHLGCFSYPFFDQAKLEPSLPQMDDEFFTVSLKIPLVGTYPLYPECKTVWQACLLMVWVGACKVQVLEFVSWFDIEICFQLSVVQYYTYIQKGNTRSTHTVGCNFENYTVLVVIAECEKLVKGFLSMCPYKKDVINVSKPN